MHPVHFPVLIVGAGPAGLAAAIALGRRGVESLVVDRRLERSSLPRATTISTRSMELIRSWGLEEEVLAGGVEVEWLMWESPTLAGAAGGIADRGRPSHPRAGRADQPDRAGLRAPGPSRARAARPPALARARARRARDGPRRPRERAGPRARHAARRGRAQPRGDRRLRRRCGRRAQHGPGAPSGSRCAAPRTCSRASRRCSARRSGRSWASTATASTSTTDPGAERRVPARGTGRPLGLRLPRRGPA